MDRFPRGFSAAGAGTAANAAACRLVHPTRPIRSATGADGPAAGGPTTQKGGRRISFTPRPAPLPFRSGAMTPFPQTRGSRRAPENHAPATFFRPGGDSGPRLRGRRAKDPPRATPPAAPGRCDEPGVRPPRRGAPTGGGVALIRGAKYLGRLRDLQPSADLGPVGGAGGSALAPAGRLRAPYVDAQAADGPFKGRGGGGVSVRRPAVSRRAPSLSTGEMARRLRGAVVVRTRAPEDGRRAVTSPPSSSASTTASCWWAARASPAAPKSATSNSACASTTPPWRTAWRSSCGTSRKWSTSRCTGDRPDPERISWGRPGAPLETTFKGRDFKYERS